MEYNWVEAESHWRAAMAREPVPGDVLFWYGNHYLLPIGRAAQAAEVESRVLANDPLNILYQFLYGIALQHCGRLRDAEEQLCKILEFEENAPALGLLGMLSAQQGKFEEALTLTEMGYRLAPSDPLAGQLAALLTRTDRRRANMLVENLRMGQSCTAPVGLALFYALNGELDEAAQWVERAIERGYPLLVARLGPLMRSSAQWPGLAKRMNLPA
jgi:tetratricopeptide (TPR) repeat protein